MSVLWQLVSKTEWPHFQRKRKSKRKREGKFHCAFHTVPLPHPQQSHSEMAAVTQSHYNPLSKKPVRPLLMALLHIADWSFTFPHNRWMGQTHSVVFRHLEKSHSGDHIRLPHPLSRKQKREKKSTSTSFVVILGTSSLPLPVGWQLHLYSKECRNTGVWCHKYKQQAVSFTWLGYYVDATKTGWESGCPLQIPAP